MKTGHMFMTKEALEDMLFEFSDKIEIEDIFTAQDGQIIFTLRGDDLPDECVSGTRQVRLIHKRDAVEVNGEGYYKYTKEVKLR